MNQISQILARGSIQFAFGSSPRWMHTHVIWRGSKGVHLSGSPRVLVARDLASEAEAEKRHLRKPAKKFWVEDSRTSQI